MNSDNGGCFGCLGALILGVCAAIYPFYDAYVVRSLNRSDLESLALIASMISIDESRYLRITSKSAKSEWLFEAAQVRLDLKLKSGGQKELFLRRKDLAGANLSDGSGLMFRLSDEDARIVREGQVTEWSWDMTDSKARRKPIKLVQIVAEGCQKLADNFARLIASVKGLFERT